VAAVVISICDSFWPSFTLRAKSSLPGPLVAPFESPFPSCIFIIIGQSLAHNLHKALQREQGKKKKNRSRAAIYLNKFQFCAHVTANWAPFWRSAESNTLPCSLPLPLDSSLWNSICALQSSVCCSDCSNCYGNLDSSEDAGLAAECAMPQLQVAIWQLNWFWGRFRIESGHSRWAGNLLGEGKDHNFIKTSWN